MCVMLAATASAASAADYVVNVTPGSVSAGPSPITVTVTLTSESQSNPLNAAQIAPPTDFTNITASLEKPSGNATVTVMPTGMVVLKGVSLKNGQSASVDVTATVSGSGCELASWVVVAYKSSLQGRTLIQDGNSSLTTAVGPSSGTCPAVALRFATQPNNARVGQTISGTAFNPLGSPVTVDVLDGLGNVVTNSSAAVTISQNSGPSATLGGSTTQTAMNGVATFNNLTLDTAGTYTLAANSSGLKNAISNSFVEVTPQTQTTSCPKSKGGACTATLSSPTGTTPSSITVMTTGQKGASGNLTLSVDVGTAPVCTTLAGTPYVAHDQNFYGFVYTPDAGTPELAKTATYTLFNTGGQEGIHLCFAAPYPFEQLDDSPAQSVATLPDGTGPGFAGLLENCDPAEDGTNPDPCQTTTTSGSNTVITISIPPGLNGDPWGQP
jgi:hypothetical protein